jgi:predicted double-glycine peptidase
MKAIRFGFLLVYLIGTTGYAFGDGQLDRTEILEILQTLTAEPRRTWIPTGTIEATHHEYRASKGTVTDSNVIVKYNGDRFYWEINVDWHVKDTEQQASPGGRSAGDDFNMAWNKRRVFAWDGARYTMYFASGKHAIVTESPSDIPVAVNGPLTAGIVPWGYGVYTLESLSSARSSAEVDGQGQIQLTVNQTDMPEMVFVLDPTKSYAVLSYSLNYAGGASTIKTYGDYQTVSGNRVPTTIVIEVYDQSEQPSKLLSYDYWHLTSIRAEAPGTESFDVLYESRAMVELYSPITERPLSYHYCDGVDTESLLKRRLAISAAPLQNSNCATKAMKYVAEYLGKDVAREQLASLVGEPNEGTSLYDLRAFARQLGFHCAAIKTDMQTLKGLSACQVILHLPGPDHYVVLDHIDDERIWTIDLDRDRFYWATRLEDFPLDWSHGTALLVSSNPLSLPPTGVELSDGELKAIVGGFPKYSCTKLIQEGKIINCSPMMAGVCASVYRQFWPRYACQEDENGGSCAGSDMPGVTSCPCVEDIENPGFCTVSSDWDTQPIRACQQ